MTDRTDDRPVMVLTAIYTLLLLGGNLCLLYSQQSGATVPMQYGTTICVVWAFAAVSAMQPWLRVFRVIGFTVLWWVPCFSLSGYVLYLLFFGVWQGRLWSTGDVFALIIFLSTIEALAIAAWVQPRVGRLFRGRAPSKGEPPSSHTA